MSNINVSNIDEEFPVQGQDNFSKGFRDNFLAIKQGLTTAKNEITNLESNSAKLNADNNFLGNEISNALMNNTQTLFIVRESSNLITLDVQEAQVQKIVAQGNTTVRFSNWPNNTDRARYHKITLCLRFQLSQSDPNLMDYRVNFSTDIGGQIRSYTKGHPVYYNTGLGGWFIKPYVNLDITDVVNNYEHVIEAWSYNNGNDVYVNYIGSYI
jgi:hypothetical protein